MKKLIILSVLAILGLSACEPVQNTSGNPPMYSAKPTDNPTDTSTDNVSDIEILDVGKNHKIYDITENHNPEYLYEIYNNSGDIVKSETMWAYPTITYPSGFLLSIEWGGGTGSWQAQYYNTDKDVFSDIFFSPLTAHGNRVVYVEVSDKSVILTVRDIFDKSKYYKTFPLDDCSSPVTPVQSAEFLNDKELEISYLSGDEYEEKTEVLRLD